MRRKRKMFLGTVPIGGPEVKSRRLAREITSSYHRLVSEACKNNEHLAIDTSKYQQASMLNVRHHKAWAYAKKYN